VQWKRENTSQRGESRQYRQSDAARNAIDCLHTCVRWEARNNTWLALPARRADYELQSRCRLIDFDLTY